jgi:hypothetical protein
MSRNAVVCFELMALAEIPVEITIAIAKFGFTMLLEKHYSRPIKKKIEVALCFIILRAASCQLSTKNAFDLLLAMIRSEDSYTEFALRQPTARSTGRTITDYFVALERLTGILVVDVYSARSISTGLTIDNEDVDAKSKEYMDIYMNRLAWRWIVNVETRIQTSGGSNESLDFVTRLFVILLRMNPSKFLNDKPDQRVLDARLEVIQSLKKAVIESYGLVVEVIKNIEKFQSYIM